MGGDETDQLFASRSTAVGAASITRPSTRSISAEGVLSMGVRCFGVATETGSDSSLEDRNERLFLILISV